MGDQSANLTGMLGQIAGTVGSMGDAYKPVAQAFSRPRGDMNDPKHLQAMAQWASSNGDSAAASMYMQQARQVQAEQKEAEEQAKAKQKIQSANAVTAQYKVALESGDADSIAKAEEAVYAGANENGYNAQDRMNAASTAVKSANDAAWTEEERARVAKETAETQKFATQVNAATTAEEIDSLVKTAPPELAEQAQRIANVRVSYLNNMEDRRKAVAADQADVSTEFTMPSGLPESVSQTFEEEHKRIEKLKEDSKNPDGTWKEQGRRSVDNAMNKLLTKAQGAAIQLAVAEESDKRQRLRTIDHRRQQISIDNPTKDEFARIEEQLNAEYEEQGLVDEGYIWDSAKKATGSEVVARFREEQRKALDLEVEAITGVKQSEESEEGTPTGEAAPGYTIGEVRNGYKYMGGDPANQANWKAI